jgi:tRNA1Val (adenine37-N6)-methyltransferase
MDLGCGNGILPLLLAARNPEICMTGLELNADSAELAKRNVAYNHLEDRIQIVQGDIREAVSRFGAASFDVLVSNPPYMTGGHGLVNPADAKAIARHEIACTFSDVARAAAMVLRPGGRFYLVHRPFRLPELMTVLSGAGLEPKRMRLVYPSAEKEPELVLLGCVKGGKPSLKTEKPLILKNESGDYTREVRENYGF